MNYIMSSNKTVDLKLVLSIDLLTNAEINSQRKKKEREKILFL